MQIRGKAAALQTLWLGLTKRRLLPTWFSTIYLFFYIYTWHFYNIMFFYSLKRPLFVLLCISLYTARVKWKDLNPFVRNVTPAPVPCVQAATASDISCCAKALLYTDSEMIVTPIIDNPKVQRTRHAFACSGPHSPWATIFLPWLHRIHNSCHVCLVCLRYFILFCHPCWLVVDINVIFILSDCPWFICLTLLCI